MLDKLNGYRIMWVLVLFDLPTFTKKERKAASEFREKLKKDGFGMFQFSIYSRHCSTKENAEVHKQRVRRFLPESGDVAMLCITDKQFGEIEIYHKAKEVKGPSEPQQLELF